MLKYTKPKISVKKGKMVCKLKCTARIDGVLKNYEKGVYYPIGLNDRERDELLEKRKAEILEKWKVKGIIPLPHAGTHKYINTMVAESNDDTFACVAMKYVEHRTFDRSPMGIETLKTTLTDICRYLGKKPIKDIKPRDIVEYIDGCYKRGMHFESVNLKFGEIRRVFRYAEMMDYVESNPVDKVLPPRKKKEMKKQPFFMSLEQLEDILNAADSCNDRFRMAIYTLAYTGMRIGELSGLKWEDIDIKNKSIHVCRGAHIISGEIVEHPTKNGEDRYIPIFSDRFLKALEEYQNIKEKANEAKPSDYFIIRRYGGIIDSSWFSDNMNYLKTRCPSVPRELHAHSFRHTFASIMISKRGINPVIIAQILGHKTIDITLFTYNHTKYEDVKEIMENVKYL